MIKKYILLGVMASSLGSAAQASAAGRQADITDISWEIGPNIPEFRKGSMATVMGGKVISAFGMRQPWGEMDTTYIYDPVTNWWSRGPNGPIGQTYGEGTELGNDYLAIGGRSKGLGGVHGKCYRLTFRGGQYRWSEIPSLNEARGWAPSAAVGKRAFVFGGGVGTMTGLQTISSVEAWDSANPKEPWKIVAAIPGLSRGWSSAAAVNGKIYLMGGSHFYPRQAGQPAKQPDRVQFNEVWEFNPETYEWKAKAALPYTLAGFDSCVYKDRYIIVAGGHAPKEGDFSREALEQWRGTKFHAAHYCPFVLVYDTKTDGWQRLPSLMPMPTNDIDLVIMGDRLYALGGENKEPATSNTTPWLRIGRINPK